MRGKSASSRRWSNQRRPARHRRLAGDASHVEFCALLP